MLPAPPSDRFQGSAARGIQASPHQMARPPGRRGCLARAKSSFRPLGIIMSVRWRAQAEVALKEKSGTLGDIDQSWLLYDRVRPAAISKTMPPATSTPPTSGGIENFFFS